MIGYNQETIRINNIINSGKKVYELDYIEKVIHNFLFSQKYRDMIKGYDYYVGKHDILKRKRTVIGEMGEIKEVYNLPNNRLVDNQYSKLVDQKNNYLLGKKFSLTCENEVALQEYNAILNDKFFKTLNTVGEDSLNSGISYIYTYINDLGELNFKLFKSFEIVPFWEDEEHTKLYMAARIYDTVSYEGGSEKVIKKVELYKEEGVIFYEYTGNRLILDIDRMGEDKIKPYITDKDKMFSWGRVPIIPFKYNSKEIPLINKVKGLQDALNTIRSDFMNNMQEDARNTILILKNYDGTNLSEFRKNLAEYGVVKVKTIDGNDGGVEALKVEVNGANYEMMANTLKKAIIENGKGFDAKDERLNNNPNQMNIQSMLADIDLDANGTELEFKASMQELFYFINIYLEQNKKGVFFDKNVEIVFNRDQLLNESEIISSCQNSMGILSKETIISQHPWVSDVNLEIERISQEETDEVYPNGQ